MPLAASVFTVIATERTEGAQGAVIDRTPTEPTLLLGSAARLINAAPLRGRGPRDNADVTMPGPALLLPRPRPRVPRGSAGSTTASGWRFQHSRGWGARGPPRRGPVRGGHLPLALGPERGKPQAERVGGKESPESFSTFLIYSALRENQSRSTEVLSARCAATGWLCARSWFLKP